MPQRIAPNMSNGLPHPPPPHPRQFTYQMDRSRRSFFSPLKERGGGTFLSHSASDSGTIEGAHRGTSPPPLDRHGTMVLYPPSVAGGEEKSARVGVETTSSHHDSKVDRRAAGAKTTGSGEEHVGSGSAVGGKATATTSPLRAPGTAKNRYEGMLDDDGGDGAALAAPAETFLESLHLDRDQLSDFSNSEGHFLYLRQKPGTDATAYNLEVN